MAGCMAEGYSKPAQILRINIQVGTMNYIQVIKKQGFATIFESQGKEKIADTCSASESE
jgi:hypothetical protein